MGLSNLCGFLFDTCSEVTVPENDFGIVARLAHVLEIRRLVDYATGKKLCKVIFARKGPDEITSHAPAVYERVDVGRRILQLHQLAARFIFLDQTRLVC